MSSSRRGINTAPIPYEDRVVSYVRRRHEAVLMDRKAAEILRDCSAELPTRATLTSATAAGDPWKLRGIPAIGGRGSVGGAISGTRPGTTR